MSITLRRDDRDVLHPALIADLGVLRTWIEAELRLLDDLGWIWAVEGETFELTVPDEQLARALQRLVRSSGRRLGAIGRRTLMERGAVDPVTADLDRVDPERLAAVKLFVLCNHLASKLPPEASRATDERGEA
jgi:hypothetical protein